MKVRATYGECSCCGKQGHLIQVWYLGYMATWACEKCRGLEEGDDEDIRFHAEMMGHG